MQPDTVDTRLKDVWSIVTIYHQASKRVQKEYRKGIIALQLQLHGDDPLVKKIIEPILNPS